MGRMITVEMDSDSMIDLLCERLADRWLKTTFGDEYLLWCQFYTDEVESGVWDNGYFDVAQIVDNDYVNYIACVDRDQCIDEYGFDPEIDEDGRVRATDGTLYLINTVY